MVKLRLKRFGTNSKPSYRIIAIDSHKRRDGKALEELGFYNPRTNPPTISINKEAALKWLKNGAQPTDTTRYLLVKAGIIEENKK